MMKKIIKTKMKGAVSLMLAAVMAVGVLPASSFAAQQNSYHDPAENWVSASNRTNELDVNAVVTHETFYCYSCETNRSFTVYRTPEYTRDGSTSLSRNVKYSDGTLIGGTGKGSVLSGVAGVDAYYTGYHYTKSSCDTCGTINANMATSDYGYDNNVYWLYDCAASFTKDLDETVTYEYIDDTYHKVTSKGGTYCGICYGTNYVTDTKLEKHELETKVIPEISNQRFVKVTSCADCEYEETSYSAAKSVVASYYGTVDGKSHTLTISDMSESGVTTSIRYGLSAESCTLTAPPAFTTAGQYTVYYQITYTYKNTEMKENGVAYIWLSNEAVSNNTCTCGCGNKDCACMESNCNGDCCSSTECSGKHNYILTDTVNPTCTTMGYDKYVCSKCGQTEKKNYTEATGHTYQSVVIREASCDTEGKSMEICKGCGEVKVTVIPKGEHSYKTYNVAATCTSSGYNVKECTVCGDRQITGITNALAHNYVAVVTEATCENGGHTTHICNSCGSSFITDYTEAKGHDLSEIKEITLATCGGQGVLQYDCTRCPYHELRAKSATGHTPGTAATCTAPQLCTVCGAVLNLSEGHDYKAEVTEPTCTDMGYTTYTCSKCGDAYKSDYTDPAGHKESEWITDKEPTVYEEGCKHKECTVCGETLKTETIAVLSTEYHSAYICGYPDGSVKPDGNMTRAEAAAVFARLIAEKKGETISEHASSVYSDVNYSDWYSGYVKYLTSYGIISGYTDGTFAPNEKISRAEFTAMAVRFADTLGIKADEVKDDDSFYDVMLKYWANSYITEAAENGWVKGYENGSFKPENKITRAEVVTLVNRMLERCADMDYINDNLRELNTFNDIGKNHWSYSDIMEAANAHDADVRSEEIWI